MLRWKICDNNVEDVSYGVRLYVIMRWKVCNGNVELV